ncbi:MAG: hypothetical protein FJX76_17035 [Armatimonadetes bacterium]|nr:hypothetical protein [Armatimonadota bacterium]
MLDSGMPGMGLDVSGGGGAGTRPRLQFSVPCLQVEDEKGPPSFKYVFYEMPFPEFPFAFPEGQGFFVANGWCNGLGAHVQRMKILDSSKKDLVDTGDQPFNLKKAEEPFMAVNFISGMKFDGPGVYWIQIYLDNQLALEYPLPIRNADPQPGGAS